MDADYWLIRFAYTPLTLATLQSDRAMYGKFKAFKNGNVYGSDSSKTRIFEDVVLSSTMVARKLNNPFPS